MTGQGAVAPLSRSRLASLRPLPAQAVTIESGPWHRRRQVNATAGLAHGLTQLRRAGTVGNFQTLADGTNAPHGHLGARDADVKSFVDSDVYKWLEAVAWTGDISPGLAAEASEIIDLIERAQDQDGYLNTWFQRQGAGARFADLGFGHELYCLGHLVQAGVAWSRARGDDRLATVSRKFADLVADVFTPTAAVCGHPCVEMALVELSRLTGEGRYRELATTLIARRGHGFLGPGRFGGSYYQDDTPYVGMDTLSGHAVRATYLAAGAVDVAVDNQDEALVEASHRQWRNVLRARTYITGGIGARHLGESFGDDYELPADAAYAETCAAIGLIMWSWRLQLTRLDSAFGDLIERAVYNAILPAVAPDGRSYHYTNPLEVHSSHPRREWFEIACCPPNAMRTISILNQFVATENDTGVQLHQYASGRVLTAFGRLQVTTSYPSGGGIAVTVFPCTGGRWELMLRVPVWSRANWSLRLNGEPFQAPLAHGFARLARAWDEADLVELTLDMAPRFTTADPRVGMGCSVVLERGPIVYCLDEAQSGVGHPGLITLPHGPPPATVEVDPESPPNLRVLVEAGSPRSGWPYSSTPSMTRPAAQMGTFVPFAMAGTRGPGAIRAWVGRQATPT